MQQQFGGPHFVNPKSFRGLPPAKLTLPAVAEKRKKERKIPENVYRPKAVVGQAAPIEAPPSIAVLATALQNDVDLIFQFIHDNIEFYPNYGLAKGGYGALCDGNGNPFDQADLMVQLLTAAGYTASYVTGYILLDADMWSSWLNVSTSDIALAAQLLANGGFANTYNTETNEISIDYCWVQVLIDGTEYQFDPAMKSYNSIAGIDLASAMEYSQSTFLSDAEIGATITDNYAQNINATNINANLSDYAMNLVSWIQANNSGASLDQILGGRTIVPVAGPVRNTTLPYVDTSYPTNVYGAGELPGTYCATVQIQYDLVDGVYKIDQTFYSSDIYGQRMSLWFNADIEAQLYLNGTVLATSAVQTSGSLSPLIFTITHPYASDFADETTSIDVQAGIDCGIGNGWGYAARQLAEIHRQTLIANIGGTATAEDVLGESLAIAWFNFIGENSSGVQIINALSDTYTTYHHQIGIIAQGSTTLVVNFFDNIWSTSQLTDSALVNASSAHVSLLWHQLEAAVVTQTSGGDCASAPSFIATANGDGTAIYTATAANWFSVVKPALTTAGYTSAVLAEIQEYMAIEEATILGDVSDDGGDVLNIFIYNSGLSTNPTQISYTTAPGDNIDTIATELTSAINANSALAGIGVTAISSENLIEITSTSSNATTYSQSVTVGDETIDLGNWTVTIPDNPSVDVGGYFTGYAFYLLAPYGSVFLGPLSGTIKGAGGPQTPGGNNSGCEGNTPDPGSSGVAESPTATSGEPIDLFKGRYLYSNTDISVGNQSDPYQLSLVRTYNSGNAINNNGLGLGWSHNYQINAQANSDGFIAFGYEAVSAAAAVIAEMYVCQDLLQSTTPSVPIANAVTICVMNQWMMNEIVNNTVIVQFGNEYQIFAQLPDGTYVPPLGVKTATSLTSSSGLFTYTTPDKVVYTFNSSGQISEITYPFGMTIDFTYTSGNLTKVSNGYRTLTLAYSDSNLSSVTDGNGRTVHYTITSSQLTKFEDALTNDTTYDYATGNPGYLTEIFMPANPTSPVLTNVYNSVNQIQTQTDAYGNVWSYFFAGSRSEQVDPNSNSCVWYFDSFGSVLQYIDQLGNATISQYDGLERPTLVSLPEGNSSSLTYDQYSNLLSVVLQPKPGSGLADITNSFTYDLAWNKMQQATDGNGNITYLTYDTDTGLLTQIQYPAVEAGTPYAYFDYNSIGQLVTVVDPSSVQTSLTYNPTTANLQTLVVDSRTGGLNLTTTMSYDDVGNLATSTDPNNNTTTLQFDANRRLTQITSPAPFDYISSFSYDANNNLIEVQSQTASSALQTYSATYTIDNLVNSATEPQINYWGEQPNPTVYSFDNLRRLQQRTDSMGNIYQFAYDARSMVLQITYPNGVISDSRTYTNNGYLETITDALSNTTQYLLDGFDRLSVTTYPPGPGPDSTTEQYSYDDNSNILQFTTRNGSTGTIGFSYDALNQVVTKSPYGQAVVCYSYDLAGRLTAASVPAVSGDPSTGTFQQAYDSAGRFYQETFPDLDGLALTVTATLDNNGNVTAINYPDGTILSRSYDQLNRLTGLSDSLGNLAFGYDPLSRCIAQTAGNGIECSAAYDLGNNLLDLTFNPPTSLQFSYDYNSVHQEIGRFTNNAAFMWEPIVEASTSYGVVNSVNQYPTVGGSSCSYNDNGCLTYDGTYSYSYDTESHLLAVTGGGLSLAFKYDPFERQVVKTVGSTSTRFVYSALQRIADYDLSGDLLNRYVYADGLTQPLWVENVSTGAILYLHADETGSIIMTSDASGTITNQSIYSPWGESTTVSSLNLGFTGQRFDPEVGLYYFNSRYYSPALGRFLQNDPIGYSGGDLNLYSYAFNDPLDLFDPLGLSAADQSNSVVPSSVTLQGNASVSVNSNSTALEGNASESSTPTFFQALVNNTDVFWNTYKSPWFWLNAGFSAIPAARLGVGAIETLIAVRTARTFLTDAYLTAKVAFPAARAQRIGQLAHTGVDEAISAAKPTALKISENFKAGAWSPGGRALKGGAQVDGRVESGIAGYMASLEYKTGKAILGAAQRARIARNAPRIRPWFFGKGFEAPVFQIKPKL